MAILLIEHPVADFDGWKQVFDADPVGRKRLGVTRHWVYRQADDPDYVVVSLEFPSAEAARTFRDQPALREAGKEAQAQTPRARILEEVEAATY